MNIIKQIKPGDKIMLRDGFQNQVGIAYGTTTNRFGTELRVKVYEGGAVYFSSVSFVAPSAAGSAIGAFKL